MARGRRGEGDARRPPCPRRRARTTEQVCRTAAQHGGLWGRTRKARRSSLHSSATCAACRPASFCRRDRANAATRPRSGFGAHAAFRYPAKPRKTRMARLRRIISSSPSLPILCPSLVLGTVNILSAISRDTFFNPLPAVGSMGRGADGVGHGTVLQLFRLDAGWHCQGSNRNG